MSFGVAYFAFQMRRRLVVCLVYIVVRRSLAASSSGMAVPAAVPPRVCVVKLCDIFSNCLAIFGVAPKESDAETFVRFLVSSETPPQIAKAARDRPASGEAKSIALANLSISLGVSPHSPYIYPGLLIKPHLL